MEEINFDYLIVNTESEHKLPDEKYINLLKTHDEIETMYIKYNTDKYIIFNKEIYTKIIKLDKYFNKISYICLKGDISNLYGFMEDIDYCPYEYILNFKFIKYENIGLIIVNI